MSSLHFKVLPGGCLKITAKQIIIMKFFKMKNMLQYDNMVIQT